MKDLVYLQSRCIVEPETNCWVWQRSVYSGGYGAIGDDGRIKLAHRVAYESLVGPIPPDTQVLHSCDNRRCINPEHLRLGTNDDNVKDALARSRYVGRRLSIEDVLYIRENPMGISQSKLADKFEVSPSQIRRILNRKQWRHI